MLSKPIQKIMLSTSILYLNGPSSNISLFTYIYIISYIKPRNKNQREQILIPHFKTKNTFPDSH